MNRMIIGCLALLLLSTSLAFAASGHLAWTPSGTAANVRVERNQGGGAFSVIAPNLPATTATYTDSTMALNQTYCWRVVEYNSSGDGPATNQACAGTIVPTGATGLTVTVTQP